jgi:hypothetical protein
MMRLAPRAKAVVGGNAVKGHKADVVAMAGIVGPRIAQTNEKFHAAPALFNMHKSEALMAKRQAGGNRLPPAFKLASVRKRSGLG